MWFNCTQPTFMHLVHHTTAHVQWPNENSLILVSRHVPLLSLVQISCSYFYSLVSIGLSELVLTGEYMYFFLYMTQCIFIYLNLNYFSLWVHHCSTHILQEILLKFRRKTLQYFEMTVPRVSFSFLC